MTFDDVLLKSDFDFTYFNFLAFMIFSVVNTAQRNKEKYYISVLELFLMVHHKRCFN